ncbi:prolyl oligopeptidase family serine peptidase [Streptomyces radicis]|uniref:S9 family peptidase n=1 Tax=Streptomyces radicis TaxID=1750517 RepID=A0A3A9WUH3_9ACTN|nr:prolyl oligopeptidase family serine peptidase [Streptomyces radicis]RKN11446.1 S9 family peptidase [Streptomyces radicis]RKN26534.1 S9 family peptidase [Streptomyces radicis]
MTTRPSQEPESATPFHDLDAYVDLPRVEGLALSRDGRRLVVSAATLSSDRTRYVSALWEVDPAGERPARRLTRGDKGASGPVFTPGNDLLFVSARPEPGASDDREAPALWVQPAGGGDARVLVAPAGGVRNAVVSDSGALLVGAALLPSADDLEHDAELRESRKKAKVTAILHEDPQVRLWDHDLGPAATRLLTAELPGGDADLGEADVAEAALLSPRDLTGHVGRALHEDGGWALSPDGGVAAAAWVVPERNGSQRFTLVAIDVATGARRTLLDDPALDVRGAPRFSPDGTLLAVTVVRRFTADDPGDVWLVLVPVAGGEARHLTAEWDRFPHTPAWTPDGSALVLSAHDGGRSPLWRVDAASGEVTRLTPDDGAYDDPRVSPDGRWVYALRSAMDAPPAPVRVPLDGTGAYQRLPGPAEALGRPSTLPGTLTEVTTTAEDGTPVRAWLSLPDGASADRPAPLLLWVHGGPVMSSNAWSWRWNQWLAVAKGYAVLQPDPALSTGYGIDFVRRGWGEWGGAPYTDLMAITDATERRPDIDASRVGAMGGSYGGYMANWIAGHTDRFGAIVTHASLWTLEHSVRVSDYAYGFAREFTPEIAAANSPHLFLDDISTPLLVIHGDKDYRVPFGEALRLWADLQSKDGAADGSIPHKFLYFPDENHWVLTPNHAKIWYETVFAFLAQHLLGEKWQRPELLG